MGVPSPVAAYAAGLVVTLSAGCSPFPPIESLEPPSCTGGVWDAAPALRFAVPPDYVAIVADSPSESGPRCDGASDVAACEAAIAEAFDEFDDRAFVVLRRGDDVRTVRDPTELAAALAPIDGADEAMLLAAVAGYRPPACDEASRAGARAVPGGWDVVAMRDFECRSHSSASTYDEIHCRHLLLVREDGGLEEQAREENHRRGCEDTGICF